MVWPPRFQNHFQPNIVTSDNAHRTCIFKIFLKFAFEHVCDRAIPRNDESAKIGVQLFLILEKRVARNWIIFD
jgi:hypothetical protein